LFVYFLLSTPPRPTSATVRARSVRTDFAPNSRQTQSRFAQVALRFAQHPTVLHDRNETWARATSLGERPLSPSESKRCSPPPPPPPQTPPPPPPPPPLTLQTFGGFGPLGCVTRNRGGRRRVATDRRDRCCTRGTCRGSFGRRPCTRTGTCPRRPARVSRARIQDRGALLVARVGRESSAKYVRIRREVSAK
jgi:hypothetical protein